MTIANEILYGSAARVANKLRTIQHVNFIDEYGYTPLIEAAIINDVEKAHLIIEQKADVNFPSLTGHTALHWAVENHNLPLCQLLLNHKANPNAFTMGGQPVLVEALIRKHTDTRELLIQHGANLTFALDFLNVKLIGHLFELLSSADIVNAEGKLVEVEFEGYFLESTLRIVHNSLKDYRRNYAARDQRGVFNKLREILKALTRTIELTHYQQYLTNLAQHKDRIFHLLGTDPLIIPISQDGHAITVVKCGNLLAICDRAKYQDKADDIPIYYMNKPRKLTKEWMHELIYEVQPIDIFHKIFPMELGLQPIARLPITPQLAGNCSWANVEASIPVLYFMLSVNGVENNAFDTIKTSMELFHGWRNWEQDRALQYCIKDFREASPARKASKAGVLGAVLFQSCTDNSTEKALERSIKILPILKTKGYEYVLESYLEIYLRRNRTEAGKNLENIINMYDRLSS